MSLQHEWINATDAAIDEKLGLVSIKVPFTVSPGESKIATLIHALRFEPPELNQIGLPRIRRDLKERTDCGYDVTFTFDGHFTPAAADGEEFTLDGSTSDDPIESHPDIEYLVAKYFPEGTRLADVVKEDGSIVFPVTLNINGQEIKNPMHGVKTYLVPGIIWTRTRVMQNFPDYLAQQLGTIGDPPTGRLGQRPPKLEGKREWIMARLRADWRGNVWKVADSWLMSGRNGATPDIYRNT